MTTKQADTMISCLQQLIERVDSLTNLMAPPERNIEIKEMAQMMRRSVSTVHLLIREGRIPAVKKNGRYRIPLSKFNEILPTLS